MLIRCFSLLTLLVFLAAGCTAHNAKPLADSPAPMGNSVGIVSEKTIRSQAFAEIDKCTKSRDLFLSQCCELYGPREANPGLPEKYADCVQTANNDCDKCMAAAIHRRHMQLKIAAARGGAQSGQQELKSG